MPTEEQLENDFDANMYGPGQNTKVGQKLPIMARTVSHLSFLLRKSGAPTGDVTFTIRKWSDKALIASKVWGNATGLNGAPTWREVALDTPVAVNEEAIIMVEFTGGDAANYIRCREKLADVKAGENDSRFPPWQSNVGVDCAYKYTYEVTPVAPTVTIQAMTEMGRNTAKGHGNVTALGVPDPTAHGHCWNTTGLPTTADSKTDLGAKGATGAFESDLTELLPGITYYVRSYAKNDVGTSYSDEISFTARTGLFQIYENLISGDNDLGSVYGDSWNAETFTPDVEHPIIKVRLKLYKKGSPGTLTVSIRLTLGGEPTGGDLCYGAIDGNALTEDTAGEWYEIEFDLGTIQDLLAATTVYGIVLRAPSGNVDNAVVFKANNGNAYPDGQRCTSVDGGLTWTQFPFLDILFEEWGMVDLGMPTVTTDPATGRGAIAASVNGTLDHDGGEACECGFEWGLDTGYGTTTPPQSKTFGETFSQVIGGLQPGTTYHFRAFATNSVGTSYGADRTFATALVISRGHALGREEL